MKLDVLCSTGKAILGFIVAGFLISCSSGPEKPKPTELAPNAGLLGVRLAWTAKIGVVGFPLDVMVNGSAVTVASSDGVVGSFDASTGTALWRTNVAGQIAAGVGSDGRIAAVVTRANELVALDGGRQIWRQKLSAQGFTAPLVAGGRVFVLTADVRSVRLMPIRGKSSGPSSGQASPWCCDRQASCWP